MAKIITFGNFKGGVGKSTCSCMAAYLLHKRGKKVLLVDFDPQANSTNFLTQTYNVDLTDFTSLYEAIQEQDLSKCTKTLDFGLDLLPSAVDLVAFPRLLNKLSNGEEEKEHQYMDYLLDPLRDQYDFIIIDVPPTISSFTNNALVASDYALIIMQTELDSLTGAIDFNEYVEGMKRFNDGIRVVGILPYLQKKRSKIDKFILESTLSDSLKIKDLVFKNHIYERERVKRFRVSGITNEDYHDKKTLTMYDNVIQELLEKVGE